MKNYIINKRVLYGLSIQAVLVLAMVVMATVFISAIVMAQSEYPVAEPSPYDSGQTLGPDSFSTNNYRPYLIKIIDGDSVVTVPTIHENPASILDSAGIILYTEDRYTFERNNNYVDEPLVGFNLFIDRATPVELSLHSSVFSIRTHSMTIAELLDEKQIILGEADIVKPSLDSKIIPGMKISVMRIGIETVTVEEDLSFERNYIDDANIAYGTEIIKTAGANGRAKVTYEITHHDNIEISRLKTQSVTLKKPVSEIVIRGTKGKPVSNGPLTPEQIQFLGNCEAGMNPTRNSGNGYYGAFQFSAGTWNAMNTGYARADLAPLDVQIQAVQQLLSRSSIFGQFPGCANRMVSAGLL